MKSMIQRGKLALGLMAIGLALFLGIRTSTGINPPICTAPSITSQPASQTFCLGYPASFTVIASGTSLSYRWRKNGANLVNGGNISGVTSNTLTISAVATNNAGPYDVLVVNTCGSVTSSVATLSTSLGPAILTQPTNQIKCAGNTVAFAVSASGAQGYQWRKDGGDVSGATSATLTLSNVTASNNGSYDVVVTNGYGSVTSSNATLTVMIGSPGITSQPTNQVVCYAATAIYSVTATNAANYQWRKFGSNIAGETNATLVLTNVTSAAYYNVLVANPCGSIYSSNATVTVNALPVAYSVTGGGTYCSGGTGVVVGLSGSQNGVTYQLRLNGSDTGSPVAGTGSAISFGDQTGVGTNTVVATRTATGCSRAMNGHAIVTVNPLPTAMVSGSTNICAGQSASIQAALTGTANWIVTWSDGVITTNSSSPATRVVSPTSNTTYEVTALSDAHCSGGTAGGGAVVTVDIASPSITQQPESQMAYPGQSVNFSITVSNAANCQWRKDSTNLIDGGSVSGATSNTLTISTVTTNDDGAYDVVVANACGSQTSTAATLSVSTLCDGIPDWWKVKYGFSLTDPNVAGDDPDGDGWSNLEEFLNGTDPTQVDLLPEIVVNNGEPYTATRTITIQPSSTNYPNILVSLDPSQRDAAHTTRR